MNVRQAFIVLLLFVVPVYGEIPSAVDAHRDSVGKVTVDGSQTPFTGSCFFIGNRETEDNELYGVHLTAGHVIADNETCLIQYGEDAYAGKSIYSENPYNEQGTLGQHGPDVAVIITSPIDNLEPVELVDEENVNGPIYCIGYVLADDGRVQRSYTTNTYKSKTNDLIELDGSVIGGMSGGLVCTDEGAIGIVSGGAYDESESPISILRKQMMGEPYSNVVICDVSCYLDDSTQTCLPFLRRLRQRMFPYAPQPEGRPLEGRPVPPGVVPKPLQGEPVDEGAEEEPTVEEDKPMAWWYPSALFLFGLTIFLICRVVWLVGTGAKAAS